MWRSEWGKAEKEAYKAGIRKGRALEYADGIKLEEVPLMCDCAEKKSKIDQIIEHLLTVTKEIQRTNIILRDIAQRQERAEARNRGRETTITIDPDPMVAARLRELARQLEAKS